MAITIALSVPRKLLMNLGLSIQKKVKGKIMQNEESKNEIVGINEIGIMKSKKDGLSVSNRLMDLESPAGLETTFQWPVSIPEEKIDFILVATNQGDSFMAAFRYGSLGLEMVYSENSNPDLIKNLMSTKSATIIENSGSTNRSYTCELKHCSD
jgi:hypothetical protein